MKNIFGISLYTKENTFLVLCACGCMQACEYRGLCAHTYTHILHRQHTKERVIFLDISSRHVEHCSSQLSCCTILISTNPVNHFFSVLWHVDFCCSWWRMAMTGTVLSAMQVVMWSAVPVVIVCTMCHVSQRKKCFKKMSKTRLFVQCARWYNLNVS